MFVVVICCFAGRFNNAGPGEGLFTPFTTQGRRSGGLFTPSTTQRSRTNRRGRRILPLEERARQLMTCCSCQCLNGVVEGDKDKTKVVIMQYLDKWIQKSKDEHKRDWLALTEACITGTTAGGGQFTKDLSISLGLEWKVKVCATAYHKIHNREHASYERMIQDIRHKNRFGREGLRSNACLSPSIVRHLARTGTLSVILIDVLFYLSY